MIGARRPPRVAIVGVHGVGRAHLISAYDMGYTVPLVIDAAPDLPWEVQPHGMIQVENRWSTEIYDLFYGRDKGTRYVQESGYQQIAATLATEDLDLLILATPTHTHLPLIRALAHLPMTTRILVEKPLFDITESTYAPNLETHHAARIFVGYEWLFNPVLTRYLTCTESIGNLYFAHGGSHPSGSIIGDLGVHLLSMLVMHSLIHDPNTEPSIHLVDTESPNSDTSVATFSVTVGARVPRIVRLHAEYLQPGSPERVCVDGLRLVWKPDAFAVEQARILSASRVQSVLSFDDPAIRVCASDQVERIAAAWYADSNITM